MAIADAPARSPEFPVHWDDPEDANRTWTTDKMHNPDPVSPLGQSMSSSTFYGLVKAIREFGIPTGPMLIRFHNNYAYERMEPVPPGTPEEEAALGLALQETFKREVGRLRDRWEGEHLPRVKQITDRFEFYRGNIATASISDIEAWLHEFERLRRELWTIHFRTVVPMMMAMQLYDEMYADLFGGTDADAHALIVGRASKSVAASIGLSDLAAFARQSGIDTVIIETSPQDLVAHLRLSEEGRVFLDHLNSYLEEFGYRSDLFELQVPTWREDPTVPLGSVRAYLISGYDGRAEHEATARSADLALEVARQVLAGYPEPIRGQFEGLVQAARFSAFLQEEHNFHIDQRGLALTRLMFLQVGRRLVNAGAIDDPVDIFMLELDEIRHLFGGEITDQVRESTRATVAERQAGMEMSRTLTAPPFLGPPPQAEALDNPMKRALARFWGGPPQTADAPNQLKGNAGSRGVATGEAFVARSLAEASNLRPGQILVATTTMPAWTPFFGVAAAVVTETGGALSHCAIVAREYGIPAVVGAAGAMRAIQPGQIVTVDGDRGIVTLSAIE